MRKFLESPHWPANFIVVSAVVGGFVDKPWLWSVIIIGIVLYIIYLYDRIQTTIEEREKVMGNRLIEASKVLADLCRNAFDHIKTNKQNIDKANAKLGEHSIRLHRHDQTQHRLVGRGNKESQSKLGPQVDGRTFREKQADKANLRRIDRLHDSTSKDVQNTKPKSESGNS